MEIRRTDKEFILLPTFCIDSWFEPELKMWRRVYTIGWLLWFVRWSDNKVVFDFETQGYESYF